MRGGEIGGWGWCFAEPVCPACFENGRRIGKVPFSGDRLWWGSGGGWGKSATCYMVYRQSLSRYNEKE